MKKEIRLNNLSEDKKMTPQEMKNLKGGSACFLTCCNGSKLEVSSCNDHDYCADKGGADYCAGSSSCF